MVLGLAAAGGVPGLRHELVASPLRLGERKVVAAQEDVVVEEAQRLARAALP